ncbi:hypothetical protein ACFWPJ_21570, partial [Nocardia sp. NPDC058497]
STPPRPQAGRRGRRTPPPASPARRAGVARELLPDSSGDLLDSAMSAYVVVSGTLELVAAWMRGEFDTTRERLTDLIARQLLQVPRTESPRATPAH